MKLKASTGRRLRYGGASAALTALIIAIVVIVNVLVSTLVQKFGWYVDMTPEQLFTLSEEAYAAIEQDDEEFGSASPIKMIDTLRAEKLAADPDYNVEDLKINIIFCDDPDNLDASTTQKYVHYTAKELENKFKDYISVEYRDIIRNPSSVSEFKENSLDQIYTSSVIIRFGTEFRVRELASFFTFSDTSDTEPWAYNGEKAFVSSILAVTRAESPIAGVVTNHGEEVNVALLQTLQDSGYEIIEVDLSADTPLPENCRLLLVFNPVSDFLVADGISQIDEIDKLDRFLHNPDSPADSDRSNSLMVFMNPETDRLNNFEDYLEEWGIKFNRTTIGTTQYPHLVCDSSQAISTDGYTFRADYATEGSAATLTEDLRSRSTPQSIIFKNAMSLSYSDLFEPEHYTPDDSSTSSAFEYAVSNKNGTTREIYDVFLASTSAKAYAGNLSSAVEVSTEAEQIKLMTMSVENHSTQESNYSVINEASYVFACGSTDFADADLLQSNSYGNTNFLLTALRAIGREPVPVGLTRKPFGDYEIDDITTTEALTFTLVLSIVPLLAATITGVVVIVRRKNR